MTESELRRKVADVINSWLGAAKGSPGHLEILNIYNTHKPLARGYKVGVADAYCATTVSAAWIRAGIAEYTGTECSCNELIRIAKGKGIWVENDAYVPKIGDAVLYDWQDSGAGDNVGQADHIGIVVSVTDGGFVVTEGNTSGGKVGQRTMAVNGRCIRGYICPDYKAIAAILDEEEVEEMTGEEILAKLPADKLLEKLPMDKLVAKMQAYLNAQPLPAWVGEQGEYDKAVARGITDGSEPTRLATRYETAIMIERAVEGGETK